jgi:hypothetical protein
MLEILAAIYALSLVIVGIDFSLNGDFYQRCMAENISAKMEQTPTTLQVTVWVSTLLVILMPVMNTKVALRALVRGFRPSL